MPPQDLVKVTLYKKFQKLPISSMGLGAHHEVLNAPLPPLGSPPRGSWWFRGLRRAPEASSDTTWMRSSRTIAKPTFGNLDRGESLATNPWQPYLIRFRSTALLLLCGWVLVAPSIAPGLSVPTPACGTRPQRFPLNWNPAVAVARLLHTLNARNCIDCVCLVSWMPV